MEDGKPVATSKLFCAGGVAGIYHIATLPDKRGRGYGTAMTLAAAHAGHKEGHHVGVLFATPAGYGVYRRLGFKEYCRLDVYTSPG
jgi:predicted GNAT family acetyltransferase